MERLDLLIDKLKTISKCYLMFSGGLDSCAILGAAIKAKINIMPVWINNSFGRANEDMISRQAQNMGAQEIKILSFDPNEQVNTNPQNRCYYCKYQIIKTIKKLDENAIILDGTTGSDNGYRPGRKALNELNVISPLVELGFTSDQAKELAIMMGADVNIANMESCMATRINYLVPLKPEYIAVLTDIEHSIIQNTGDYNVRCRLDDEDHIRIELSTIESFNKFTDIQFRNEILQKGESIAMFTTLDLKPSRPNAYDNRITS